MKAWFTLATVLVVPACSFAQATQASPAAPAPQAAPASQAALAPKPCEDLKSEIATKLDAKGVKAYTLEIVAKDQDAEGKAVGSCEGGTKKIMYRRGGANTATPSQASASQTPATQTAAKEPSKP